MIIGIHHTAISVPDIDAAVAFYSGVLGFEIVESGEWEPGNPIIDGIVGLKDSCAKQRMLKAPNAFLELFEYTAPAPQAQDSKRGVNEQGYTHFCLQVEDIHGEYERLQKAGMTFHAPPQDLNGAIATYGRDPFGNVIELYEVFGEPFIPLDRK
jgi:catechol 2,3-dioxygenase-like lactoylglutathione lyase family enzyme